MDDAKNITGALRVLDQARDMFIVDASVGNDNTLWQTMGACIRDLTHLLVTGQSPMALTIAELHNIWFIFTLASSNIDHGHPAQDRLTRIICSAREIGLVTEASPEAVTTPGGRVWADLPYLVDDVKRAWEQVKSTHDPSVSTKACNLVAGIARLASLGICNESFTGCGLEIMKLALEDQDQDQDKDTDTFYVIHLLAMVEVWLLYAGDKLFALVGQEQSFLKGWNSTGTSSFKSSATDAGFAGDELTRTRVLLWKYRLTSLESHDDESVVAAANRCSRMIERCCHTRYGRQIEAWAENGKSDVQGAQK